MPYGQGLSRQARRRRRARQAMPVVTPPAAVPVARRGRGRGRGGVARGRGGQIRSSFVHCVIDPFSHPGMLTGVPDRFSGLSLAIENRVIGTLSSLKKNNYMLIIPSLGENFLYFSDDNEIPAFTSAALGDKVKTIEPILNDFDWVDKYRTVSLAAKIRYIGPAAIRNGCFRVSRINWDINMERYTITKSDKTTLSAAIAATIDLTQGALMSSPSAVSMPVEDGVYATAVRTGGESWDFVEVTPPTYLTTDDLATDPNLKTFFPSFSVNSYDGDWTAICIYYACTSTSGTKAFGDNMLEIEVRHCAEVCPRMQSTGKAYRTLTRPSPRHDESALNLVSSIQRETIAAIPHRGSWFDRLGRGVGSFLGNVAVGALSGPINMVTSGLSTLGLGGSSLPALPWK